MRIGFVLAGVAALLAGRPAASQPGSSQIRGAIVDEANRPVAGARVTAIRQGRMERGPDGKRRFVSLPFSAQAIADATGSYRVPGLAAGAYDLCTEAPGYLTNCEWTQWARVNVAAGASADQGRLVLTKAATVTVRINDPLGLMRPADRFALPLVAVRDQYRRLHRARQAATQGTTHILEADVPYGTPLSLRVHSARFLLTDGNGAAVSRLGTELPFQVPPGGIAPAYTFTISSEVRR